jgi:hypothetical protein
MDRIRLLVVWPDILRVKQAMWNFQSNPRKMMTWSLDHNSAEEGQSKCEKDDVFICLERHVDASVNSFLFDSP